MPTIAENRFNKIIKEYSNTHVIRFGPEVRQHMFVLFQAGVAYGRECMLREQAREACNSNNKPTMPDK